MLENGWSQFKQTWNVFFLDSEKIFSLIWDQCIGPKNQDYGDSKYALVVKKAVGDNTNDQPGFFDMKAGKGEVFHEALLETRIFWEWFFWGQIQLKSWLHSTRIGSNFAAFMGPWAVVVV